MTGKWKRYFAESKVRGALAAILALRESADAWASLELDGSSVLVLSTEGATDPANYERITGRTPEQVRAG